MLYDFESLTVDISESRTLTAKAVPQANGWVRYSSVSGSSSSSWSRNWTLLSLPSIVIMGTAEPYSGPMILGLPFPPSDRLLSTSVESEARGKIVMNVIIQL